MFITIEGVPDKTEIATWLAERIRRMATRDVLRLKFPATLQAEMSHALDEWRKFPLIPSALAAADYYTAAVLIRTHLRTGGVVISESWATGALVEGIQRGVDREWLESLYADLPTADLNILLDGEGPYAEMYRRLWKEQAARDPYGWAVVDTTSLLSPRAETWARVEKAFKRASQL